MLTAEEQDQILRLPMDTHQIDANRDFVRLGAKVDHACLIAAGLVGRFDQNSEGIRQITAIHIPGDMADMHSVVQPKPTSALQALSVATIHRIAHADIRAAAARFPAIAEAFWRDTMVDATILSQWIVNVGRRNATSRVAHLICEMAIRLKAQPEGNTRAFPFVVTQSQIGEATGLTSVHINRVFKSLRSEKLVETQHREMRVLDWTRLSKIADFRPGYLQMDIEPEDRIRITRMTQ